MLTVSIDLKQYVICVLFFNANAFFGRQTHFGNYSTQALILSAFFNNIGTDKLGMDIFPNLHQ